MVDVDRQDDGDGSLDHIRRVPGPSHAHLDDGHVDRGIGERGIPDGDEDLEVGHPRAIRGERLCVDHLDERHDLVVGRQEGLFPDRLAGQGDPLTHRVQVW